MYDWFRSLPKGYLPPDWTPGSKTILKPVCQQCQKRLNVRFESPAALVLKPMLDGSEVLLSPPQAKFVAAWGTKTALVLRLKAAIDQGMREATQDLRLQLLQLIEGRSPAPTTTTRIAYLADHLEASRGQLLPAGWPDVVEGRPGSWISVIAAPGLICETICAPSDVVGSFIDMTKDDDRFIVVWPEPPIPRLWPPREIMSLFDLDALSKAWGHRGWEGNFPTISVPTPPPR